MAQHIYALPFIPQQGFSDVHWLKDVT